MFPCRQLYDALAVTPQFPLSCRLHFSRADDYFSLAPRL